MKLNETMDAIHIVGEYTEDVITTYMVKDIPFSDYESYRDLQLNYEYDFEELEEVDVEDLEDYFTEKNINGTVNGVTGFQILKIFDNFREYQDLLDDDIALEELVEEFLDLSVADDIKTPVIHLQDLDNYELLEGIDRAELQFDHPTENYWTNTDLADEWQEYATELANKNSI